jgi:hypothetical protein
LKINEFERLIKSGWLKKKETDRLTGNNIYNNSYQMIDRERNIKTSKQTQLDNKYLSTDNKSFLCNLSKLYDNNITVTHDSFDHDKLYTLTPGKVYRVFNNNSWKQGGRFYGAGWLALPMAKEYNVKSRDFLFINGEPTIELDYSGLHVRMLYHLNDSEFNGECYVYDKEDEDHAEDRFIIKIISLVAINAENKEKAFSAARHEYFKETNKGITDKELEVLYNRFINRHEPIAEHIASGKGVKLQYRDSIIMDNILYRLMVENSIVALPVHDSLVVQAQHEPILRKIMIEEYEKEIGFEPIIG